MNNIWQLAVDLYAPPHQQNSRASIGGPHRQDVNHQPIQGSNYPTSGLTHKNEHTNKTYDGDTTWVGDLKYEDNT